MAKQFIYPFTFGDKSKSDLLGGKGANLAEMVQMGLPVPPGFTITTDACREYLTTGSVPAQLHDQIHVSLANLEKIVGKNFGDASNPLLVSVRSGAKHSMPGMMETVLNVGITPEVADALAKSSGNEKFAWDSYRRFIDMFGRIVCDLPDETVHQIEGEYLKKANVKVVADLSASALKELAQDLIKAIEKFTNKPFPNKPIDHLTQSIEAVFKSWNSERAQLYRRRERIPSDLGTAVNIQSMVFGNLSDDSGTGVAFTRNPATGEMEVMAII